MLYKFGTGSLYGVPSGVTNPTPVRFGGLQDVSIDSSFDVKELYGQFQFPIAVARGQGKITGKAKFAQVSGALYNSLFFGETLASGQILAVDGEAGTPAASAITVANSATWVEDLGVMETSTGFWYSRVAAGSEVSGESYSVAAGVYTFASGDTTAKKIYYTYTDTGGFTLTVTNQLQGVSPFFEANFNTTYNGKSYYYKLYRCISSKLTMASKMADWNIDEFDFSAFANDAGDVFEFGLGE